MIVLVFCIVVLAALAVFFERVSFKETEKTVKVFKIFISFLCVIFSFVLMFKYTVSDIKITVEDSEKVDSVYKDSVLTKTNLYKCIVDEGIQHPDLVLKQALLETGNFTSNVCKEYHNLFGLRRKGKYMRFKHWSESVTAYKRCIQDERYYTYLKNIGYAEDPKYIEKVRSIPVDSFLVSR